MRLFQGVGCDGGEALGDVPGAAGFGVAQGGHDGEQAVDATIEVVDRGIVGHGSRALGRRENSRTEGGVIKGAMSER